MAQVSSQVITQTPTQLPATGGSVVNIGPVNISLAPTNNKNDPNAVTIGPNGSVPWSNSWACWGWVTGSANGQAYTLDAQLPYSPGTAGAGGSTTKIASVLAAESGTLVLDTTDIVATIFALWVAVVTDISDAAYLWTPVAGPVYLSTGFGDSAQLVLPDNAPLIVQGVPINVYLEPGSGNASAGIIYQ